MVPKDATVKEYWVKEAANFEWELFYNVVQYSVPLIDGLGYSFTCGLPLVAQGESGTG